MINYRNLNKYLTLLVMLQSLNPTYIGIFNFI